METKDGKSIGELGFRGPALDNSVEIGYGIKKEYEGQGYTTEAAKALIDWAFNNEDVFFVEAEADEENAASIHILEKLGFDNMVLGMSIGMMLGLCLGASKDAQEKKKFAAIKKEKYGLDK